MEHLPSKLHWLLHSSPPPNHIHQP
jgi:hypothetical protein